MFCFAQYGCVGSNNPPNSILKDAIEVQIHLTRSSLEDFLDLDESPIELLSVKVDSSKYVQYEEEKLLLVSGYFECRFPGFRDKSSNPFTLFLERNDNGKEWRLAKISSSSDGLSKEWFKYPLNIQS